MSDRSAREASKESPGRTNKRTRICGPQSKNGCFTCKRRRIKCDEGKPACQRCIRSKIHCEGYSERSTPVRTASIAKTEKSARAINLSDATPDEPLPLSAPTQYCSPRFALLDRYSASSRQDRLAQVGINLLSHGLRDQFEFTLRIFDGLLPRLSYALPSVNAAAAALGAIFELQSTASANGMSEERNTVAATQYGRAIKAMQQDLQQQRFGPVPLLMICMLLASSELLLRRRSYSLMHIQAGFKILEERRAMLQSTPSSPETGTPTSTAEVPLSDEDEIFLLFRTFDIHSSTYADRRMPTMPTTQMWTPPPILSTNIDTQSIGLDLIAAIHSCLFFTSGAGQYKYLPASRVPSEIFVEQGRHLGILNAWLTRLDRYIMPKRTLAPYALKPKRRTHLLMLRNMCLSTIIFASTILSPYETAWDDYLWHFEEIVAGAEEIMSARESARSWSSEFTGSPKKDKTYSSNDDFQFTFTPLPGVIQPLCLTAFKYRHATYRRRAARLICKAGREGPWIGELVAAVAERLIDVEESGSLPGIELESLLCDKIEMLEQASRPASIPEGARISGVGMDGNFIRKLAPGGHDSKSWTARRSGETQARFFKCKDVEGMLAAGLELDPGSPFSATEADDGSPNGGRPAWKNEEYWEDWSEILKF